MLTEVVNYHKQVILLMYVCLSVNGFLCSVSGITYHFVHILMYTFL